MIPSESTGPESVTAVGPLPLTWIKFVGLDLGGIYSPHLASVSI